jgi:hypothetical protein
MPRRRKVTASTLALAAQSELYVRQGRKNAGIGMPEILAELFTESARELRSAGIRRGGCQCYPSRYEIGDPRSQEIAHR